MVIWNQDIFTLAVNLRESWMCRKDIESQEYLSLSTHFIMFNLLVQVINESVIKIEHLLNDYDRSTIV